MKKLYFLSISILCVFLFYPKGCQARVLLILLSGNMLAIIATKRNGEFLKSYGRIWESFKRICSTSL